MIDHLLGRPSPSWKRTQVFLVIIFWLWRILHGDPSGPRLLWLRRANRLLQRFTPWQLIVSTLTGVYALRNIDKIVGLSAPDPLANLYSPSYYRAVWIAIGLDAGFATAMTVRPKWLKDICSVLFSLYYIVYATEAQEKIRRYRAVPTVEMLRTTWEKAGNPYLRALTPLPSCSIARKILLPRPKDSTYQRPITAWLFFAPPEVKLGEATDLIFDVPGGGFIAMTPLHHEQRLRLWSQRSGKPVLAIDYGKAPEYPYPFAIDEVVDVYRSIVESTGTLLGMSGRHLNIIMTGDSAGATIAVNAVLRLIETREQRPLPLPSAMVLSYAALDFNFASWMSPANLRALRSEQSSSHLANLAETKDHFKHKSPLSMVSERRSSLRRRKSWRDSARPGSSRPRRMSTLAEDAVLADVEGEDDAPHAFAASPEGPSTPLTQSTLERHQIEMSKPAEKKDVAAIGTRMTMTSRTGYFQDKIITPSMMRAMALLYIGPTRNPDFATDYHVSPILTPLELLAQFPPLLMNCGEKDPFVDDTVIFAARVREAKRARKQELDLLLAGKSARFGENLRMSQADRVDEEDKQWQLRRERDRLAAESEDDWVWLVLYPDWSHGYLQMLTLMPESKDVANDLADWMIEIFGAASCAREHKRPRCPPEARASPRRVTSPRRSPVQTGPTPDTSETSETDSEMPIAFISRRLSTPRSSFSGSRRPQVRQGSDETLISRPSPPGSDGTLIDVDSALLADLAKAEAGRLAPPAPARGVSELKATTGNGTPTLTGAELLKRRRLLDAHIFE